MLPIKQSDTKTSSIVAMGERLVNAMKESGEEYLMLNRGVNSVVNIDLSNVVSEIDFNSDSIQVYPGSKGKIKLRNAINEEYFDCKADTKNILITGGGIMGLDITFQNLHISEVIFPKFFWGTYAQILNLRAINYSSYINFDALLSSDIKNKAIIICDPGNPLGEKYDDKDLLNTIEQLNKKGAIIIYDSPYRRLFYDIKDTFFQSLLNFDNVIIIESFSKSLGLSGQRIGFIHSSSEEFIKEATLRILYSTNGINGFAQTLVSNLLFTHKGKIAVDNFKQETTKHIKKNIAYLIENKLLATELYQNGTPLGIFAIINKDIEKLFEHRIGAVGLNYFTLSPDSKHESFSRILVAIPHEKFVSFFRSII